MAFLCLLCNYAIRTFRIQVLTGRPSKRFFTYFGVTGLYGFFNYLLPFKTGELSYPLMLNRHLEIPLSDGAASLLTARFFDLATIALFLPVVIVFCYSNLPPWLLIFSLFYCFLILSLMILLRKALQNESLNYDGNIFQGNIGNLFFKLIQALRKIQKQKQYTLVWFYTILIWICIYLNFYFIVLAMGYTVSLVQMVVVLVLAVPISLMPIQGFANVGTHELAWVTAFSIYEMGRQDAVKIAVNSHLILFLFVIILGVIGWLFITVVKNQRV